MLNSIQSLLLVKPLLFIINWFRLTTQGGVESITSKVCVVAQFKLKQCVVPVNELPLKTLSI